MNRWTRRVLTGLSLVGFCSAGAGCADEREPINRVQPNALDKTFFVGNLADDLDNPEFFSKAFVIDQSAGQNGISVGLYSGTDRIKWEVTENALIAHKSYQIVQGQDDKGKPGGPPNGTVVAQFAITGHFDIKRSYNPQTGEELNVVEENTSDRPWHERQYMRVDWSSNHVVDPMWGEIFFGKIFGDLNVMPLTYTVTDPSSEDAPYFDVKDGYFDVTNKYFTEPKKMMSPFSDIKEIYGCALIGIFTGTTSNDCNNQEATVRHSFWKVKADHSYEPTENTKRKMDVVANFGGAGDSWQPGFAGGTTQCWDPQYAYTDACFKQYLVKTNFWANSHAVPAIACDSDADVAENGGAGDGTADQCASVGPSKGSQCDLFNKKCTLPLRDRSIKPVGYWLNKETPQELLDPVDENGNVIGPFWDTVNAQDQVGTPKVRGPMEDVMKTWNQVTLLSLAYGRDVECRRTGGQKAACHAQFFEVDGNGKDVLQMLSFGGWGVATPKMQPQDGPAALVSCHAPVRAYDHHETCGPTGEVARNGDQRKNFIYYWPYDSDARYGGVAGLGQDPETGESHGVTATVMGRSATGAASRYRDYIQYALGDISLGDFNNGTPQFIFNKIQQNGYSPMSEMAKKKAGIPLDEPAATKPKASLGEMQAKNNVFKDGLSGFLKAQTLTTFDAQLQSQAQPVWEALAAKIRGTEYEAEIVTPEWAMSTTGANPYEGVSSAGMDAASPFRDLDPGRTALWRAQIGAKLAAKGICFVEDVPRIGSVNWAGMSRWYLDKFEDMGLAGDMGSPQRDPALVKARGEFIYRDLFKGMARGIAIHEVGHCLGMRHNFASSYDSANYMPQYWQLRTNEGAGAGQCIGGDPATCVGPRYDDPETEDELGLAPRDAAGRSQGRPGVQYFGNTSVMEYEQDYLSPGMGTYDVAYMKAVYGGVLETYDIDDPNGIAEADQDQFAANIGLQLSELNIRGPAVVHYTDLTRELKVFRPEYCRDATPDELAQGEWRVVHGKICGQSPRDHFRWKDFVNDNDDGNQMPFSWLNLTAWKTRKSALPADDQRVRNRWNYRYGETYGHGYLHTNYSDAGADAYEVATGTFKMFDMVYPQTYFRRQNKEFYYASIPARTADQFMERARSYHWILQDRGQFGEDFEKARVETFHFLARAALAPEPGDMQPFSSNGETMYDVDSSGSITFPAKWRVGLGDGRYVSAEFSNILGGNWDYLSWIDHAGYNAERGFALRALFDGRPTLFTISRETYLDGRNVMRNFRDDIPEGVDRLIGGILSEDWPATAMWVGNEDIPDPAGGLPFRSVETFDLTGNAPTRPAGSAPVFPNLGYRQQVWIVINANLYARMNSDSTLLNKMAIYIEGIDFIAALPDTELVKFTDPNSGFTYVARLYGPDTINGKSKDKGIASRMLQHANDLKAAGDTAKLQKYVGLIDMARGVSAIYAKPGIYNSIPDKD